MPRPLMCPPELFDLDLSHQTALVTGANSGIGKITAQQLAIQGARVVLACRNVDQGEAVCAEIRALSPSARVEVMQLDLASLTAVHQFARAFLESHDSLHLLINNAGVMNTPKQQTEDGFELQFGVNHLGHFLLTQLLLERIRQSGPARIVSVASCFHDRAMGREGDIHFNDLHFETTKYDGWKAYAQSKLANVLFAKALAKRLEGTEVTAVSVHPGWVRTHLARHSMPQWVQNVLLRPMLNIMGMIEPWEGAQTSLYAALAPEVPSLSGQYFSQTGVYRDKKCNAGGWPLRSPNPNVNDAKAQKLWRVSEELVKTQSAAEAAA